MHILWNVIPLPFVQTNTALEAGDEVILAGEKEAALGHSGGGQVVGVWPPARVKTVPANYEVPVVGETEHLSVLWK